MDHAIWVFLVTAVIAVAAWGTVKEFQKGGGCCGEHQRAAAKVAVKDKNKAHYPYVLTWQIGGMTCEMCARKVENALNVLDGVWAQVDIGKHIATIRTKDPPEEAALRRAVQQAGYVVMGEEKP